MFGIGFPELILIMALALIVVGPDKLPELARSLAKTLLDLKKTAEGLKNSLETEDNPLSEIKPELEDAARNFKETILDGETQTWKETGASNPTAEDKPLKDIYGDYADIVSEGENLAAENPPQNGSADESDSQENPTQDDNSSSPHDPTKDKHA